jgi:hypothetical protein
MGSLLPGLALILSRRLVAGQRIRYAGLIAWHPNCFTLWGTSGASGKDRFDSSRAEKIAMRRKREQIMQKARAKHERKIAKKKVEPVAEDSAANLTTQVKEVVTVVTEKVGSVVQSATAVVKSAVTTKRARLKRPALPAENPM